MSSALITDRDTALMRMIRGTHAPYFNPLFTGSTIKPSFVAALEANESGGNPGKSRFEAAEVGRFVSVLAGIEPRYQGISSSELQIAMMASSIAVAARKLVDFCSSWGPLQIMGWQAIKGKFPLGELQSLEKHYVHGYALLRDFQIEFRQTAAGDDAAWLGLFTCWNAGSPSGKTTDPEYAARGLARMKIYEALD